MPRDAQPSRSERPLWKIPEFWLALSPWLCILAFGVGLIVLAVLL